MKSSFALHERYVLPVGDKKRLSRGVQKIRPNNCLPVHLSEEQLSERLGLQNIPELCALPYEVAGNSYGYPWQYTRLW